MFEVPPQMFWIAVVVLILCGVVLKLVVHHGKRGRVWLTLANFAAFTVGALAAVGLYQLLLLY